ncbi:MAG: putative transcriptional regulator [Candidatus Methanohalarchaeum thermophilum]|uniref:Putative HTH-type transcriptional regulatory protein BTN85_0478 n=1 Tax=Methanohalarchaeum thermophilum TaxID=1903181 RepID=A0A1Q6DUE8_METT1|nr:MAG: putative transcriptional regulator [Candidatus Methanohalarchaeum thermophilum]
MSLRELDKRVVDILKEANFNVSDRCNVYPKSFDRIANKENLTFVLKVLKDINGLKVNVARVLVEISSLLDADPLLVGVKNRGKKMERGVAYERHGIKAITPDTLRDYLIEDIPIIVYAAPGGNFAKLNSNKLKEERLKEDISRGELASRVGVTRSTIRKYEEGADSALYIAIRLEDEVDAALFEGIDLSRSGDPEVSRNIDDPILSLLSSLGLSILPTERAPFKALSKAKDKRFLTGIENYNKRLKKKAHLISSLSGAIDYKSFIVVKETETLKSNIDDTPLISEDEVFDIESRDEFLEVVRERSP